MKSAWTHSEVELHAYNSLYMRRRPILRNYIIFNQNRFFCRSITSADASIYPQSIQTARNVEEVILVSVQRTHNRIRHMWQPMCQCIPAMHQSAIAHLHEMEHKHQQIWAHLFLWWVCQPFCRCVRFFQIRFGQFIEPLLFASSSQ